MAEAKQDDTAERASNADQTDDMDVAAAMGFGSFGTKPHLEKKRKLDDSSNEANSEAPKTSPGVAPSTQEFKPAYHALPKRPALQQPNMKASQPHEPTGLRENTVVQRVPDMVTQDQAFDQRAFGQPHHQYGRSSKYGRFEDGELDLPALRRGVKMENGDIAYYDPSFIEDPWARLRAKSQDTNKP
ncbi:uncharacterized protein KY384_007251 [Bacidia gigantensis]|uniref:uncharacterized protein n=1 Tax=Bacidia gigantensis TaxID=2732470 RepID=UPI001D03F61B|nr:uncharacterized protein KY384_007251 [Bacidia gigantensis]KAG8528333.1 hypothetical protein KY384_007251 [Bacidia gigantensis]